MKFVLRIFYLSLFLSSSLCFEVCAQQGLAMDSQAPSSHAVEEVNAGASQPLTSHAEASANPSSNSVPRQQVIVKPLLGTEGPENTSKSSASLNNQYPRNEVRVINPGSAPPLLNNSNGLDGPLITVTPALTSRQQAYTIDLTAPTNDVWQRIRYGFAIPNIDSVDVQKWEAFYGSKPDFVRRVAERASRYLYHIVEEIEHRGLPMELALLPFIESAYNPWALSPAQASGLWQFIPSTGKNYNLKQDWWRDERRDIVASTGAALDYLQNLYEMYGDWHLALASYNWGEGAVKRALEKNRARGLPTDYLSLQMPDETRNYVPKLQAIKNIIARPDAYGITLSRVDNQPYFVTIRKNKDIDMSTAAQLAEMPLEEFRALNPQFHRPVIPGTGSTSILLPVDKEAIFYNNLQNHQGNLSNWTAHRLSSGEKLASVAQRYGLSASALLQANGLHSRSNLSPGQVLLVPARGAQGDIKLSALDPSFLENSESTTFQPRLNRGVGLKATTSSGLAAAAARANWASSRNKAYSAGRNIGSGGKLVIQTRNINTKISNNGKIVHPLARGGAIGVRETRIALPTPSKKIKVKQINLNR